MEKLIRDSEMDESEKAMWLELLPTMTDDHKFWLRTNIETEKYELGELEKKYGKIKTEEEKVRFRMMNEAYLKSRLTA
jgi:hypothetical protein